jgi:KUP system potassium uptake protein
VRERAARELQALDVAYEKQVVYILGKEDLKIRPQVFILKRAVLAAFVWMRENTRTKVQELNVPIGQLVEVGYVKEI